ncbi:serine protease 7 [Drosophila serrata]|uniref:serine protease 7 n=1 Tax=Drosophila serrata TaxID=7274 RepID=UPI000A1D38D4|nr:serine protease 7 [Drosophila serrata]
MAWSEMRCTIAAIVAVFILFICPQLSAEEEDGFQLLERDCGLTFKDQTGPKIINGFNAKLGAHPWMAFLHTPTHFTCAGSLINHWFVLTAAHCIHDDIQLTVRLGEYNRDKAEDCLENLCMDPAEEYEVSMAFRHKFYDTKQHTNDIGMLRLDRRVTYKAHIQPICVFVDSKIKPLVDRLTWFNATGWGITHTNKTARVLQELRINRRPYDNCERMFGKRMSSMIICSGNDDSNLCNGDSGGPQGREMSYGNSRVYVQLGIASFTNRGCNNVSILTDVLSHGNWIKRVVQRFGIPEPERTAERLPLGRRPTFYRPI